MTRVTISSPVWSNLISSRQPPSRAVFMPLLFLLFVSIFSLKRFFLLFLRWKTRSRLTFFSIIGFSPSPPVLSLLIYLIYLHWTSSAWYVCCNIQSHPHFHFSFSLVQSRCSLIHSIIIVFLADIHHAIFIGLHDTLGTEKIWIHWDVCVVFEWTEEER